MHEHLYAFVALASRIFAPLGPVYHLGSRLPDDGSEHEGLRPLFGGHEFIGIDERRGPGVDRVEDLTNLSLASHSAGVVLCIERLETVFDVPRMVDEMIRVLAPGGLAIVAAHMEGPPPGYPWDYWRITPNCMARMFGRLDGLLLGWQGPEYRPHTALAIACQAPVPASFASAADEFMTAYNAWVRIEHETRQAHEPVWSSLLSRYFSRRGRSQRQTSLELVQFSLQLPDERPWREQLLRPRPPQPKTGSGVDESA
jgi:SAM-dependent methyltransferase